jgi:integrase
VEAEVWVTNIRNEDGAGSIKFEGGKWVPLLPRALSKKKPGLKNPDEYRERLKPCETREEAERLLAAAVSKRRREPVSVIKQTPFAHDAEETLQRIRSDALRRYSSEAQANRRVSTPKGVLNNWLRQEPWFDKPTALISTDDLQDTINKIMRTGRTQKGNPVSPAFIQHIFQFMTAVFEDRGIKPSPTLGLELPKKSKPKVEFWSIREQNNLFQCEGVDIEDRIMAGCGMGLGLRKGELLSLEIDDVHIDDDAPHVFIRFGGPDRSPPKGNLNRRVELFEPGLGFLKLWLERFFRNGRSGLVFGGPLDGYQKHWPDQFPKWGKLASLRESHSHMMRHSYAVSMLSGTWGYQPQTLDFISKQLGHKDLQTTERYYAAYEQKTWQHHVARMTGRTEKLTQKDIVTAAKLLGRKAGRKDGKNG